MTLEEWFKRSFPIYVTQGKAMKMFFEVAKMGYQQGYEDGRNHRENKSELSEER